MAVAASTSTTAETRLRELLAQRIAVLDGAWGTMLQGRGLEEEDFRGERFRDHPRDVKGDPDLLNLTRPDLVLDVHRAYLEAGADITTTNTFTATSIAQADYGLEEAVYDLNVAGARLARQAADEAGGRFVAGSVGPLTSRSPFRPAWTTPPSARRRSTRSTTRTRSRSGVSATEARTSCSSRRSSTR